jgi:hypothetical protein
VPLSAITATWPLLLGMGVLMLGAGLQGTLLGLRATLEGFPALLTGTIMSCYYVGYVLGTVIESASRICIAIHLSASWESPYQA